MAGGTWGKILKNFQGLGGGAGSAGYEGARPFAEGLGGMMQAFADNLNPPFGPSDFQKKKANQGRNDIFGLFQRLGIEQGPGMDFALDALGGVNPALSGQVNAATQRNMQNIMGASSGGGMVNSGRADQYGFAARQAGIQGEADVSHQTQRTGSQLFQQLMQQRAGLYGMGSQSLSNIVNSILKARSPMLDIHLMHGDIIGDYLGGPGGAALGGAIK